MVARDASREHEPSEDGDEDTHPQRRVREEHMIPGEELQLHEVSSSCGCHPVQLYANSETGYALFSHRGKGEFS